MAENKPHLAVLRRKSDFQRLKERGRRFRPKPWLLLSVLPNESEGLRCGWTISNKVTNAVVRNRLKRWCREFFRQNLKSSHKAPSVDINVIFLKAGQEKEFFKSLERVQLYEALQSAWTRIQTHYQ